MEATELPPTSFGLPPVPTSSRIAISRTALLALLGVLACSEPERRTNGPAPGDRVQVILEVAPALVEAGDRVSLSLLLEPGRGGLPGGILGRVHFDAGAYRFLGQADPGGRLSFASASSGGAGQVPVLAVDPAGLEGTVVVLIFEARTARPATGFSFQGTEAVGVEEEPMRFAGTALRAANTRLPAEPVTPAEVAVRWGVGHLAVASVLPSTLYGDVNGDGRVSVGDVVLVANAAVGNLGIGGDAVIAADVAPTNLPGLGEAGDALPPGEETHGGSLGVADVLLVSRGAVGLSSPVVGQQIPPNRLGPRFVLTPYNPRLGSMTAACQNRVGVSGPWSDPSRAAPWPECIGLDGRPMLVQFCGYMKNSDGSWTPAAETAAEPRCVAELPMIQRGGV